MSLGRIDDTQLQQFAGRVRQEIGSGYVKQEPGKGSRRIGTQLLRILEANIPVERNSLRRSWIAEGSTCGCSGWAVRLVDNAGYASYIENDYRQTPGRYVLALKKRLVRNWVPNQFCMKRSVP